MEAQPAPDAPAPKAPAPKVPAPKVPAPKAPADPSSADSAPCEPCTQGRSALDDVVRAIASGVGPAPSRARVFVAPLTSDAKAPAGDALLAKLVEHVAGRLGDHVEAMTTPVSRAEARAQARDVRGFLYLEVAIQGGRLRVTADAYPVPRSIWAKARTTQPGPVAHAQASASIDAEVRSYLEPVGIEATPHVAKYAGADPEILAMACGDLDGDGGSELVTVNRQRVVAVRLAEGKVEPFAAAVWSDLAPVAAVPLREPLGFATIVEGARRHLDVSITDRAVSLRLDHRFDLITTLAGLAVPHGRGTACAALSNLLVSPRRAACSATEPEPDPPDVRHATDALASMAVVAPDGTRRTLVALRKDNTLVLRDGDGDKVIARVGAQLALGDVDQDGAAEVMSSVDTLDPKFDAVEVRTILPRGTVKKRLTVKAPGGVRAVAVCPPDGPKQAPMVIATGAEIWVVR